jgi:hypothetical protein
MWNGKHIRAAKKAHTQGHHVHVGNCMCVSGMGEQDSHVGCFRWELRARSSHPPMFNTPQKPRKTGGCGPGCHKPSCDTRLIEKAIGTKVLRRGSLCDSVNQSHTYYHPSTDTDEPCNDVTLTTAPLHLKLDSSVNPGTQPQHRVHMDLGDALYSVVVKAALIEPLYKQHQAGTLRTSAQEAWNIARTVSARKVPCDKRTLRRPAKPSITPGSCRSQ